MESYLVGDIRFNTDITPIETKDNAQEFLIELQELMNLYGVTKIDISIDIYKYLTKTNENTNIHL